MRIMTKIRRMTASAMAVISAAMLGMTAAPSLTALTAHAYSITPVRSTEEVTQRLNEMESIYKGKHWGSTGSVKSKQDLINAVNAGYSDPGMGFSMADRESALGLSDYGTKKVSGVNSNKFSGTQCWGFAVYMGYVLTGNIPKMGSTGNGYTCYKGNALNGFTLRPGDIIRNEGYTDWDGTWQSEHVGLVWRVDGSQVTVVESNVRSSDYGANWINWGTMGYHASRSKLKDNGNLVRLARESGGYVMRPDLSGGSQPAANTPSTLSLSVTSAPSKIAVGELYGLRGSISSNYNITEVIGRIYNASGSVVQETHDYPNKTSVNIRYLNANQKLYFNYLDAGYYTLEIVATDGRETRNFRQDFTVGDPAPADVPSTISVSVTSAPSQLNVGQLYGLRGTISSNYNITEVIGRIYDAYGNVVQETHDWPNTTSCNIKYLNANQQLYFNYLDTGYYTMEIVATDGKGTDGYKKDFTVGDPAAAEAQARAEAEARRAEEEARAQAEAQARAQEQARAEEEARRAAEAQARAAEEESRRQQEAYEQICVVPDEDNLPVSVSGDTGAFELHLCSNSSTAAFTAASDKIWIVTRGNVEDLRNGNIYTDANKHFIMSFYDVTGGGMSYAGGYYANCDNIEGGLEFSVRAGHQYRIFLETEGLGQTEAVIGDGHIYGVR